MRVEDMRLDGNAVGGVFADLFGLEMTDQMTVCASCGAHEVVACLEVYVCSPGTVVRCRHCHAVMMCIVEGRDRTWLGLSGVATLELRR